MFSYNEGSGVGDGTLWDMEDGVVIRLHGYRKNRGRRFSGPIPSCSLELSYLHLLIARFLPLYCSDFPSGKT